MAVLNQEIYIGSVTEPLFYFDKDHIGDPSSIQSVDLIGEVLSINTFSPIVYYEGTDYDSLRLLPFGTPIWYYTNGALTYKYYISKITRQSKKAFQLECVSAIGILDKSYHQGGVYYGRTFGSLAQEVISSYITDYPPDNGYLEAYSTVISTGLNSVTLNGTPSRSFFIPIGSRTTLKSYTTATAYYDDGYSLSLVSGHHYQVHLKLESGTVTKNGTTYSSGTTLPASIILGNLMKPTGDAWSDRYVYGNGNSSSIVQINSSTSGGLSIGIYGGTANVTFNNATFTFYLIDHDDLPYSMSEEVAKTKIFGWLPFDTRRNNLHQMLFATNASVLRDENGDMRFEYITDTGTPPYIDDDRMYISGSVEYPTIATEINVTEHSYQYVTTVDRVTLFDNSDSIPTENSLIIFDNAPIAVASIEASEDLEVIGVGENYAIVSGIGILTGIPYVDKTSIIRRYYSSAGENYTVNVDDATLVSAMNSSLVADRLKTYYTSAKIIKADVKMDNEKVGHRYKFTDAFEEVVTGYLKKITTYSSSFIKASCEFITGYSSKNHGNSYDYHLAIDVPGIITVPSGTKAMRVTLIGGGDAASSGTAGEDPEFDSSTIYTVYQNQEGGKGGEPGEEGYGGWIREIIIKNPPAGDWTTLLGLGGKGVDWNSSTEVHELSEDYEGGHTVLTAPNGTVYSTDHSSAYVSNSGIVDLFTSIVYGKRGKPGVRGGNGGRGNSNGPGEAGESIYYNGYEFEGGSGGSGIVFSFERVERTANAGGAGGSGASAYAAGADGEDAFVPYYYDATESVSGYKAVEYVGIAGGSPHILPNTSTWYYNHTPGDGGNAGCGGAGRGGYGAADRFTDKYDVVENEQTLHVLLQADLFRVTPKYATSSRGGPGEKGYQGAIIIYSDKPLSFTPIVLNDPVITNTTTVSSTNITFTFVNVGTNITYSIERRPIDGSWIEFATASYATSGATYTFTDNSANSGESFEYRIKALGMGIAKDSDYSNSIITGYGATKLATPVAAASQQTWGVKVQWNQITNADAYILAYRSKYSVDDWAYIKYIRSDTYETGLIGGSTNLTYEFKICAISTSNTYIASDWSDIVEATSPSSWKCWTPSILSAQYYDSGGAYNTDGVMLRWSTTYTALGSTYIVQRKNHNSSAWETIAESNNPMQGYFFNSFATSINEQYDYRIKSIKDGWTDSNWSPVYTVTIEHVLPAPIFETLEDSGKEYVTCNVEVTGIDSHAQHLIFDISINGGSWAQYKDVALTGSQSYTGTYADAVSGGAMKYGGTIRLRCYVTADGYSDSGYSEEKEISVKERIFFWDGENNRYWDHATKTYKQDQPGSEGWQGIRIYYDDGSGSYEYYEAASFTKDENGMIDFTSNGHLVTIGPVCDPTVSLSSMYSKLGYTGSMTKSYSEGAAWFGSCNLYRRSNTYTFIDWRATNSAYTSNGYVQAGTGSAPGTLRDGSVTPITKRQADIANGIGTYICFYLNGGRIGFDNVFAIKK